MDYRIIAQVIAIIFCIALGILGAVVAAIGAWQASHTEAGQGIMLIVLGTIALGFAGIIVSVSAKLLGLD